MTQPTRRDRSRPAELVGLAAGIAVFIGLGVLMSTREWLLALEFFGGAFIVALVVLAMLMLTVMPKDAPPPGEQDDDTTPPPAH